MVGLFALVIILTREKCQLKNSRATVKLMLGGYFTFGPNEHMIILCIQGFGPHLCQHDTWVRQFLTLPSYLTGT